MNDDNSVVVCLYTDGDISYDDCTETNESRPAFLLPSDYTVEVKGNPLEQYNTRELAEELFRRFQKEEEGKEVCSKSLR